MWGGLRAKWEELDYVKGLGGLKELWEKSASLGGSLGGVMNLLAGLVAYCFQPKKPSITPLAEHQISFA